MCSLNITDKFIETSLLLKFHNNKFGKVGTRLRGNTGFGWENNQLISLKFK